MYSCSLQNFKALSESVPRVQLIENAAKLREAQTKGYSIPTISAAGLDAMALYATGVAVHRSVVLEPQEWAWATTGHVVEAAHQRGLTVTVYTLDTNVTRYEEIAEAGVDGVFSNNVEAAFIVRELLPLLAKRSQQCQDDIAARPYSVDTAAAVGVAVAMALSCVASCALGAVCFGNSGGQRQSSSCCRHLCYGGAGGGRKEGMVRLRDDDMAMSSTMRDVELSAVGPASHRHRHSEKESIDE